MVYYGTFASADIAFLNNFVAKIHTSAWMNGNHYFFNGNGGRYIASDLTLAGFASVTTVAAFISTNSDVWNAIRTGGIVPNGWPITSTAIYVLVLGPNVVYTNRAGSCAWHTYVSSGAQKVPFSLVHNQNSCTSQSV